MASEFRSMATAILGQIRPSSTFLTVKNYVNNYGEIADYSLCFHIDYKASIKRAQEILKKYEPKAKDCIDLPYSVDHLRMARSELLESYQMTLDGYNPLAMSAHAYDEVVDPDGKNIPGIKLHTDQDVIHLYGFKLHKRVILPGIYPPDNRGLKTIAKDVLRDMSPLGRFTQYKLVPGRFRKLVVENMAIKEQDVLREVLK